MVQPKPHNAIFQAELIAIKEIYTWASQSNQPIKIWTDSEYSLPLHLLFKNNSPLAQDIQNILLNSPKFKLGLKRMWDMRVTRQRISSQRKPPWTGSQHNIQLPGTTSKRNSMPSPPNSGRMNGTTLTLDGTSTSSFQRSRLPQLRGKDQK
ncbi:hypothetical protein AVEN_273867-1 [Araneus ventricosus]|uniref:RNase H type-1 domain-containing protein n=1 Tax=Araneus ventricosus TaxID=182803 RepID=A0A4Y2R3M7_ARAVE|nr:hypothetical protein AVEN_273867-1 [Araneus ventricosus]